MRPEFCHFRPKSARSRIWVEIGQPILTKCGPESAKWGGHVIHLARIRPTSTQFGSIASRGTLSPRGVASPWRRGASRSRRGASRSRRGASRSRRGASRGVAERRKPSRGVAQASRGHRGAAKGGEGRRGGVAEASRS